MRRPLFLALCLGLTGCALGNSGSGQRQTERSAGGEVEVDVAVSADVQLTAAEAELAAAELEAQAHHAAAQAELEAAEAELAAVEAQAHGGINAEVRVEGDVPPAAGLLLGVAAAGIHAATQDRHEADVVATVEGSPRPGTHHGAGSTQVTTAPGGQAHGSQASGRTIAGGAIDATANVDVRVDIQGGGGVDGRGIGGEAHNPVAVVEVQTEAPSYRDPILVGSPGEAPEALGTGPGVRAILRPGASGVSTTGSRAASGSVSASASVSASLGGLLGHGIDVDGHRLRLGDLGPLSVSADASVDMSAQVHADAQLRVTAELEHAQLPLDGGETNVVVRVTGGDVPPQSRSRLRIHLVVDRSSSMHSSWGDVIAATLVLLDELHVEDEVQIVAYGGGAEEVLPPTPVGDGSAIRAAISGISVGGGTNIEAGLNLAYGAVAQGSVATGSGSATAQGSVQVPARSLVILVSDGVPNGGAYTAADLAPMARQAQQAHGCTTSVIGLGGEFDPGVLRAIARAGDGGYHVAQTPRHLAPMLAAEFHAHELVAAGNVNLNLDLPAGVDLVSGPSDLVRTDGGLKLPFGSLEANEHRSAVFRIRVAPGRAEAPRLVTNVRVAFEGGLGGQTRRASRPLRIAFGDRAQLQSPEASLAVADKDLRRTLDSVAVDVANGRAEAAAGKLRAHVVRVDAGRATPRLRNRGEAVLRFATALETLVPTASHSERREFSVAMGALSVRLGF